MGNRSRCTLFVTVTSAALSVLAIIPLMSAQDPLLRMSTQNLSPSALEAVVSQAVAFAVSPPLSDLAPLRTELTVAAEGEPVPDWEHITSGRGPLRNEITADNGSIDQALQASSSESSISAPTLSFDGLSSQD